MTPPESRLLLELAKAVRRIHGTDPKDFVGQRGTAFGDAIDAVERELVRDVSDMVSSCATMRAEVGFSMTRMQAERLRRRMSQTDLAAAAGKLSASDISRFERAYGRPYPAQAQRLAAVLGLEPDTLLESADESNNGVIDLRTGLLRDGQPEDRSEG